MQPTTTCPACGASAFSSASRTCERCGYADGEINRCPHCGATSRVERRGEEIACGVCGGPRMPRNLGGDAAKEALVEQKRSTTAGRIASFATVAQAIAAVVVTLIGLAIAPAALAGKIAFFVVALLPLLLAMRSRGRAARARAAATAASERAWAAAAEEVASQAKGGITAEALGKTLGIATDHADRILTGLAVHDRTRIDVDDNADVVYSVHPEVLARVADGEQAEAAAEEEEAAEIAKAARKERVP